VDFDTAVLAEPLSIAFHAVRLLGHFKTENAAILGAGPMGLCTLLALRNIQVQTLFVTEKILARLEAAKELGSTWTGNPDQTDIVRDILDIKPEGMDAVFECCGDQEALDQAIQLLKPGGRLYIIGIPESDEITFDISALRRKEILIQNVRRQNQCLPEAIQWIEENRFGIDHLITHRFSLDQIQEAFDLVSDYRDNVIKAVVNLYEE
jgi:threonine dehydrogenase-like Zn-dependent dehydrogenase